MVAELVKKAENNDVSVIVRTLKNKKMAIESTASVIVKSYRKDELDMTQEEFASKCEVSKKTIENIEKGIRVRRSTLSKVLAKCEYQIIEKIEKI